jgi:hypothetical protein
MRYLKNKIKDHFGYILVFILIVLGSAAKDYSVEFFKNQEWTFSNLNSDAKRNQRINNIITELRIKSDADNVTVFVFHNGGFFSSGVPYRKASAAYESNSKTNSHRFDYNNIPLSYLAKLIEILTTTPDTIFIKTPEIEPSQWKYMLLNEQYVSNYFKRIQIGQKMIGYVRVSYSSEKEKDNNLLKNISEYTDAVSGLLAPIEDHH